jgi:hypothetical protein
MTILYGARHGRLITAPLDWAACGTAANYAAHRRRGQDACTACKAAHARDRAARGSARCREGCGRQAQGKGLCATHFRVAYGMTFHAWKTRRRG